MAGISQTGESDFGVFGANLCIPGILCNMVFIFRKRKSSQGLTLF
jgi:hypothetical protein